MGELTSSDTGGEGLSHFSNGTAKARSLKKLADPNLDSIFFFLSQNKLGLFHYVFSTARREFVAQFISHINRSVKGMRTQNKGILMAGEQTAS